MIISIYSPWDVDRLLRWGNRLFMGVLAFVVCFEIGVYCWYPWFAPEDVENTHRNFSAYSLFPYEAIGTGALMLNPQQTWGWVSHIAKELAVIAHNSRPDVSGPEAKILLSLKTSQDPLATASGKTLFLEQTDVSEEFIFSDAFQSIWIKPILLENGRVLIEAGKKIGAWELGHGYEEKGQFVVSAASNGLHPSLERSLAQGQALTALKNARCWGKDLLIQRYGGLEFRKWKDKYKIEFAGGGSTYVIFVAPGDYLLWKEGQWHEVDKKELSKDFPIAFVKEGSLQEVELTVWDESGFFPTQIQLRVEPLSALTLMVDSIPTHLRLRTSSQVSCLLGKKRMILREGDWFVKTSSGWRALRHRQEIESCLQHRLKGELLIVDSLEKEAGRWMLKGTLFDEMRMQVRAISIPVEAEKGVGKGKKKRTLPFLPK